MIDKELLKMSLEAVNESVAANAQKCGSQTGCCCPNIVVYLIWTNCVTINNGACPDWDFCEPSFNYNRG
jgi:hypothetical protein